MKTPIIIVNFKSYPQTLGEKGVQLAELCEMVAKKRGVEIAIAVETADIYKISHTVNIPVIAQHIDPNEPGNCTGYTCAEDVKENGAVATILNHSEHRIGDDVLKKSIKRAKEVGIETIVCANTPEIAEAVVAFGPDYVAVEPPELIGTTTSVSEARPEVITETVERVRKVNKTCKILCGAGIHNAQDVKIALKLGTDGVLLASGVVKSDNPATVLNDICNGIEK